MTDLPPLPANSTPVTALLGRLQADAQALGAAIQQQMAANVEKLIDSLSTAPLPLQSGTRLDGVLLPQASGPAFVVAPEGSFALPAAAAASDPPSTAGGTLPRTGGAGQVTQPVTLIVTGGDNPVHAELVALGNKAVTPPVSVDLLRLTAGLQVSALSTGADSLGRTVYTSPLGAFALSGEQQLELQGGRAQPPVLSLRIAALGSEIQASVTASNTVPLDKPLAVTLARVAPDLVIPAVLTGVDERGGAVLATPSGTFLAQGLGKETGTIGLKILSNGPEFEAEILTRNGKEQAERTRLTLTLGPASPSPHSQSATGAGTTLPVGDAAKILGALGHSWPALGEALETLTSTHPSLAQKLIERVPQAGSTMAAQILGFLGALKSGSVEQFLGADIMAALRQSHHHDLADSLEKDIQSAARLAQDSHAEWRPVLMPFFDGSALQQVPLLIARPPEEEANTSSDSGTRFLVCVDFSALGPVRIDGFVQPGEKFLDLTLMSAQKLPDDVRSGVEQRFYDAMGATAMGGRIQFRIANPFPVQVLEKLRSGAGKRLGTVV